jgi:hypothetical protein
MIEWMMEAVRTSETSVDNYFTRQYIPEDNSELEKNYGIDVTFNSVTKRLEAGAHGQTDEQHSDLAKLHKIAIPALIPVCLVRSRSVFTELVQKLRTVGNSNVSVPILRHMNCNRETVILVSHNEKVMQYACAKP